MQSMKIIKSALCLVGFASLLSACSDPLSCSSDDAKNLVLDVVKRKMLPATNDINANRKIEIVLNLADIRTEEMDKSIQKSTCSATINMGSFITLFNEEGRQELLTMLPVKDDVPLNKRVRSTFNTDIGIIYTLQLTSEGKLYATVRESK
jgi:hypothetical protein